MEHICMCCDTCSKKEGHYCTNHDTITVSPEMMNSNVPNSTFLKI